MDRNEVMEIAESCGMTLSRGGNGYWDNPAQLARFAELVAAREREACARVCAGILNNWRLSDAHIGAHECVKAIRARASQSKG